MPSTPPEQASKRPRGPRPKAPVAKATGAVKAPAKPRPEPEPKPEPAPAPAVVPDDRPRRRLRLRLRARKAGRRTRGRIMIVSALAGAVAAMVGLRLAGGPSGEVQVALLSGSGGPRIELVAGDATLGRVAKALAEQGNGGLLERGKAGWVLARTLVVKPGAELDVDGKLRLVSEPGQLVGLEARGGRINVRGATVSSWDRRTGAPDTDPADGRAWVLAADRASLDVLDASMLELGYDQPERTGVAWRAAGTGGEVRGSTFSGNFIGAATAGSAPMRVRDSLFTRARLYGFAPVATPGLVLDNDEFSANGKHGLFLTASPRAVVSASRASGNAGHGMVVFQRSDDVQVRGAEVHDNGLAGIDVNDADRVVLSDDVVYANWTGVTVHDGAEAATLLRDRLTANRVDGLRVSAKGGVGAMAANLLDQNYRAGVYLDGGTAIVGPGNRMTGNEVGLWVGGDTVRASVTSNVIAANVLDGVHLENGAGPLDLRANTIRSNGKAAFSVERPGAARPYAHSNAISDHEDGLERLRGAQ